MKKFIYILLLISFVTTNVFANTNEDDDRALKIKTTDNKVSVKLDLGLNKNLLGGLAKKIDDILDDIFVPIITDLKDMRKENIQNLQFTSTAGSGLTQKWMSLIGLKDGLFTSLGICKPEDPTQNCDSNSKEVYFKASELNPFTDIRKKFKEETDAIIKEIKATGADFRKKFNKTWNKTFSPFILENNARFNDIFKTLYGTDVFYDYLVDELIEDGKNKESAQRAKTLKALIRGESSPSEVVVDVIRQEEAKNDNPLFDYTKVKTKVGGNVASNKETVNNLCDLALGIFDKSDSDLQKKINDMIKKLRKELYKYAVYKIVQTLVDKLGIITTIQQLSKMARCAVEATMSLALGDSGIGIMSWSETFSGINNASDNQRNNKAEPNTSAGNSDSKKMNAEIASCMNERDKGNKEENNVEVEFGLSNYSTLTNYFIGMWSFSPFMNLSLGVKGQTNFISNELKTEPEYEACLQKGKSNQWMEAYKKCIDSDSQLEFKIKDKISKEIARLFNTTRKAKKQNCEFLEDSKASYVLSIPAISVIMNPANTQGLNYTGDKGNFDYFGMVIAKIAHNKIELFQDKSENITKLSEAYKQILNKVPYRPYDANTKTAPNRFFVDAYDYMNCGGIDNKTLQPYVCKGDYTKSNGNVVSHYGLRTFCSERASEVFEDNRFQKMIKKAGSKKSDGKAGDFNEWEIAYLSDMYHCADMISKVANKPLVYTNAVSDEPKPLSGAKLSYMLNAKWLLVSGQITQQQYEDMIDRKIFDKIFDKFESYTKSEKVGFCVNSDLQEDIKMPSRLYTYCKQFKLQLFDEILTDAKTDYKDTSLRRLANTKKDREDVMIEIEDIRNTYNIF